MIMLSTVNPKGVLVACALLSLICVYAECARLSCFCVRGWVRSMRVAEPFTVWIPAPVWGSGFESLGLCEPRIFLAKYIPRTTEAAIIIYLCLVKKKLLEGPTFKRSFLWDVSFWILDGSSKLWCFEWNGILSIPQVWRRLSANEESITHVSSLKTSTKNVTNWNGINSQPNGVNSQPNGVSYFRCKKCAKCKNGSWPGKNTAKHAKQLKRKSLAETAEITEATIISLAWAGGRNFAQPAGLGIYTYIGTIHSRYISPKFPRTRTHQIIHLKFYQALE